MSSSPIERPVTPVRQEKHLESVSPCPSASTSGVSLYETSTPNTPSSSAVPAQRDCTLAQRRGKSVEALENSLRNHPIYRYNKNSHRGFYGNKRRDGTFSATRSIDEESSNGHKDNEVTPSIRKRADSTSSASTDDDLSRRGLPSACVFVANLAASKSDDELQQALQNFFSKIGKMHVKIRRDEKGNPYSFCQFESDEDARKAIRDGRGAIIDASGRRIRCEPAKVNRTLLLSKIDNGVFDDSEARKALVGFGQLESLDFVNGRFSQSRGIRNGCYVRFVYRQDAVDCHQHFRSNNVWTVEWANNCPTSVKSPTVPQNSVDQYSIFVGQLNADLVTREALLERFGKYGKIMECNLVIKPGRFGKNAFAFLKFEEAQSATCAMEAENNGTFLDKVIHVQRREIHERGSRMNDSYGHGAFAHPINPDKRPTQMTFTMKDIAELSARLSYNYAHFNPNSANLMGIPHLAAMNPNYNQEALLQNTSGQNSIFQRHQFYPTYYYNPSQANALASAMSGVANTATQGSKEAHEASPFYPGEVRSSQPETHTFQPLNFEGPYGSFLQCPQPFGQDLRYHRQYSPDAYDETPTTDLQT